mgnify:CR=1 FL=1
MKKLIFLFLILILIVGCKKQSYTAVMPPLEKQEQPEQPIQSGCSVEGINKQKDNIEYIGINEEF